MVQNEPKCDWLSFLILLGFSFSKQNKAPQECILGFVLWKPESQIAQKVSSIT